jgi:hypothetical protein
MFTLLLMFLLCLQEKPFRRGQLCCAWLIYNQQICGVEIVGVWIIPGLKPGSWTSSPPIESIMLYVSKDLTTSLSHFSLSHFALPICLPFYYLRYNMSLIWCNETYPKSTKLIIHLIIFPFNHQNPLGESRCTFIGLT